MKCQMINVVPGPDGEGIEVPCPNDSKFCIWGDQNVCLDCLNMLKKDGEEFSFVELGHCTNWFTCEKDGDDK